MMLRYSGVRLLVMLALIIAGSVTASEAPRDEPEYARLVESEAWARALPLVKDAAGAGEAQGLFYLAKYYYHGWAGVKKDKARALDLYRQAAAAGDARAMNNIGSMYYGGDYVEKDHAIAWEWFKRAADGGNATSMLNIGLMYRKGQHVPVDADLAISWYEKAIANGRTDAYLQLGHLYRFGDGTEKNAAKAVEYYSKGGELGCGACWYELGRMYEKGDGTDISMSYAMYHYSQASQAGHGKANDALKRLHDAGTRLPTGAAPAATLVDVPVFLMLPLSSERMLGVSEARRKRIFQTGYQTLATALELRYINTTTSDGVHIGRHQDYVEIVNQPESSHSSWYLPDFSPVRADYEHERWRKIRIAFSLPPGKRFSDYEIPLSFQTNLGPENLVNLFVFKSGRVGVQTAVEKGKYEHQFSSDASLDPDAVNLIELATSSHGNWVLDVNGKRWGAGAFSPRFFVAGLSNRIFIEGSLHIRELLVLEQVPPEKMQDEFAFSKADLVALEYRSNKAWQKRYMSGYFPEENAEDWNIEHTSILMLRRNFKEKQMEGMGTIYTPEYIVESLLTYSNVEGERIVLPVQKEIAPEVLTELKDGAMQKGAISIRVHLGTAGMSDVATFVGSIDEIGAGEEQQ